MKLLSRFRAPAKTHEEKILELRWYTRDATPFNMTTEPQFIKTADGVYSTAGRYYYSDELWDQYMREERWPSANHDFRWNAAPVEVDVAHDGSHWPRRGVTCTRCGETRDRVSMFADMKNVNIGWCIK